MICFVKLLEGTRVKFEGSFDIDSEGVSIIYVPIIAVVVSHHLDAIALGH